MEPIEIVAHASCGRIEAVATAQGNTSVQLLLEGKLVDTGRRRVSWRGEAFDGGAEQVVLTARTRRHKVQTVVLREVEAELSVKRPPEKLRAGRIPLSLRLVSPCPEDDFLWRVTPQGGPPSEGGFHDRRATAELHLPEGEHELSVELLWKHALLQMEPVRVSAGPPCIDEDGDGACTDHYEPERFDCDDHEPRVHVAHPEVPDDGLDNDCRGGDAGDRDRDGFHAAGPYAQLDCDDSDPTIHPGAIEQDDWIDSDCDGSVAGERMPAVRLGPEPGVLQIRDGEVLRSSPSDDEVYGGFFGEIQGLPRRLKTPDGTGAWLVRLNESSTSVGGGRHYDEIAAVFVAEGCCELSVAGVFHLYGWTAGIVPDGEGSFKGTFSETPRNKLSTTRGGLRVGQRHYRWEGHELVPDGEVSPTTSPAEP